VRFSGFKVQSTLDIPQAKRPSVPLLGRSGAGYQLCYNLKTVMWTKAIVAKAKEGSRRNAKPLYTINSTLRTEMRFGSAPREERKMDSSIVSGI
jgi:hypothetical protein